MVKLHPIRLLLNCLTNILSDEECYQILISLRGDKALPAVAFFGHLNEVKVTAEAGIRDQETIFSNNIKF